MFDIVSQFDDKARAHDRHALAFDYRSLKNCDELADNQLHERNHERKDILSQKVGKLYTTKNTFNIVFSCLSCMKIQ